MQPISLFKCTNVIMIKQSGKSVAEEATCLVPRNENVTLSNLKMVETVSQNCGPLNFTNVHTKNSSMVNK